MFLRLFPNLQYEHVPIDRLVESIDEGLCNSSSNTFPYWFSNSVSDISFTSQCVCGSRKCFKPQPFNKFPWRWDSKLLIVNTNPNYSFTRVTQQVYNCNLIMNMNRYNCNWIYTEDEKNLYFKMLQRNVRTNFPTVSSFCVARSRKGRRERGWPSAWWVESSSSSILLNSSFFIPHFHVPLGAFLSSEHNHTLLWGDEEKPQQYAIEVPLCWLGEETERMETGHSFHSTPPSSTPFLLP